MTKRDPAPNHDDRRRLVRDPSLARIDQAVLGVLDLPTDRERRWALELLRERAPELFQADGQAVPAVVHS